MGTVVKVLAGALVGLACGGAGGAAIGARLGSTAIVTNWATTEAKRSEEMLQLVQAAGDGSPQRDQLEAHLNVHLFGLMPATREGFELPTDVLARLQGVAAAAAKHRAEHPWQPRTQLDRDVEAFLATVPGGQR